jgi:hypothetical protein
MVETKVVYNVDVEFTDSSSVKETFSNLEDAKSYLDGFDNLFWYQIERVETSGGMIVTTETIESYDFVK